MWDYITLPEKFYCFRAFVCSLANENTVRIFRIGKKDTGGIGNITAAFDFDKVGNQHCIAEWFKALIHNF